MAAKKYVTLGGDIEYFDALYRHNNELLLNTLDSHNYGTMHGRCNRETGAYSKDNGTVSLYKQAPYYQLPSELIEFVSIVNTINKPHACPVVTVIDYLHCIESSTVPSDQFNQLEWVWFLDTDKGGFYINCNPQSPKYGNILLSYEGNPDYDAYDEYILTYNNITELVHDFNNWMTIADVVNEFDIANYIESVSPICGIKYKDLFLEKYDNDLTAQIYRQNVTKLTIYSSMYTEGSAHDFATYVFMEHEKNI